ncbi:MAG: hypothetical protein H0X66_02535 [Verrucomicrobia bacterium]|nr:hypothetical protein [Verrucomicrobiota bacterium]
MDWQEITALGIVGVTIVWFVLRAVRRRRKFSFERDTHCGCSNVGNSDKGTIVICGKRGEPPQIRVKMK